MRHAPVGVSSLASRARQALWALACAGVIAGAAPSLEARALRGNEALAKVYDAIFDADFARAARLSEDACPPAPDEACLVLDATRLLWEIQLDPEQMSLDADFTAAVTRAITAADAWTRREPKSAEAWFYLGGAYGARVQWRVLRAQTVAAARDGKQIKLALEQALLLDPAFDDAQFGLGLYEYYADVAPAAAKMLRWLLLLPGGSRTVGLRRMLHARAHGTLIEDEAAYQLHLIYLWYERNPLAALGLLRELAARHPTNPLFARLVADVQDVYLHDCAAALAGYRTLLERARAGRVEAAAQAEVEARLGLARQLDAMGDTDLAIEELRAIVEEDPPAPYGAGAEARVALAAALDRVGERVEAERLYRAAIASPPARDPGAIVTRARRGLSRRPDVVKAKAYGLSLEAWRQFQRSGATANIAEAEEELARAVAMDPQNTIARYRYARVLMARHQPAHALAQLDIVLGGAAPDEGAPGAGAGATGSGASGGNAPLTPPTILAEAALAAGGLHEQAHDRPRAIDAYRRAAAIFGAAAETRSSAQRALAKLER